MSYHADQTELAAAGMRTVVRNERGTIVCYTREADGRTAEENAALIAQLLTEHEEK